MLVRERPLVAMSTKAYFGCAQTEEWLAAVASDDRLAGRSDVDVAVLPAFPVLGGISTVLGGTGISWGAQDVAPSDAGAQTGEVTAAMLAECGCVLAEIGHAERRGLFGETTQMIRDKIGQCARHGVTPLLCVGERELLDVDSAIGQCVAQAREALDGQDVPRVVIAYEPIWAIGAREPADPERVRAVCRSIRSAGQDLGVPTRVIYGGTAGPGVASRICPDADGVFLGRRAHDIDAFARVVDEVAEVAS